MAARVTLIAAVSRNGVIGAAGAMPWRISEDLKRFKALTMGKPVVMGRKTFDSIGKALPGRTNIVVTRAADWRAEGVQRAGSIDEALKLAEPAGEAVVIGGAEIYAAALPRAQRILLTRIDAEIQGDATFPPLDPKEWRKVADGIITKGPRNDYPCRLFILERLD